MPTCECGEAFESMDHFVDHVSDDCILDVAVKSVLVNGGEGDE